MIATTTNLLTALLGDVFTAWLTCEPIKVLLSLLIVGYVVTLFVRLLTNKY